MLLRQIVDPKLAQNAYLIGCQRTREAVVIDPERDVDRYVKIAAAEGLRITAVTETHIHADYLSGTRELAVRHGARAYLSAEGGPDWTYGWSSEVEATLLGDGDGFKVGNIELKAVHTPGHTPEHVCFLVYDHGAGVAEPMGIASGDFVFVGDLGRPDLLESAAGVAGAREPAAESLFDSLAGFMELPDYLQVWPAHGAGSACGKALGAVPTSTVGYEKRFNASIAAARSGKEAFVDAILDGQPEPPAYFARMKRLNRDEVPLLGELPTPALLEPAALASRASDDGVVVVDTRAARLDYMSGHLGGSVYAPLNKSFPTIAGSYVSPREEILLVVEPERLEEAVRDLARVGLDRVAGFAPPAALAEIDGLSSTPVIDFGDVATLRERPDTAVLDVRGLAEFEGGCVPDAVNVAHTRLVPRREEIPAGVELLVHCKSGARAASAASQLERMGHRVRYVDDAFARWPEAAAS